MSRPMPRLYFMDVPEYRPFIDLLGRDASLARDEAAGYVRFSGDGEITVRRAATGLGRWPLRRRRPQWRRRTTD